MEKEKRVLKCEKESVAGMLYVTIYSQKKCIPEHVY